MKKIIVPLFIMGLVALSSWSLVLASSLPPDVIISCEDQGFDVPEAFQATLRTTSSASSFSFDFNLKSQFYTKQGKFLGTPIGISAFDVSAMETGVPQIEPGPGVVVAPLGVSSDFILLFSLNAPANSSEGARASLIYYKDGYRKTYCRPGPSYNVVSSKISFMVPLSRGDLIARTNPKVAFACKANGVETDSRLIEISKQPNFGGLDLKVFDGLTGESVSSFGRYLIENESVYFYMPPAEKWNMSPVKSSEVNGMPRLEMTEVEKQLKNGGSGELAFQLYSSDETDKPLTLKCEKRPGIDTLINGLTDKSRIAKSFPSPSAGLSSLSTVVCSQPDQGLSFAQDLQNRYHPLIHSTFNKYVSAPQILDAKIHPLQTACASLSLTASSEIEIEKIKAKLGESLEGVYIRYSVEK